MNNVKTQCSIARKQVVALSGLCNMDVAVERTWMTDICSSTIAPALSYYRPSMDICNICTSYIRVGRICSDLIKQPPVSFFKPR